VPGKLTDKLTKERVSLTEEGVLVKWKNRQQDLNNVNANANNSNAGLGSHSSSGGPGTGGVVQPSHKFKGNTNPQSPGVHTNPQEDSEPIPSGARVLPGAGRQWLENSAPITEAELTLPTSRLILNQCKVF
jgi:hypothetical protein